MAKESTSAYDANSAEGVALKLFQIIHEHEFPGSGQNQPDRKWVLDTYAECIRAVRQPNTRLADAPARRARRQGRDERAS